MAVDYSLLTKLNSEVQTVSENSVLKYPLTPIHASALLFINSYNGQDNEGEFTLATATFSALEYFLIKAENGEDYIHISEDNLRAFEELSPHQIEIHRVIKPQTINTLVASTGMNVKKLISISVLNYIHEFNECLNANANNHFPPIGFALQIATFKKNEKMIEFLNKKQNSKKDHKIRFLPSPDYTSWEADLIPEEITYI